MSKDILFRLWGDLFRRFNVEDLIIILHQRPQVIDLENMASVRDFTPRASHGVGAKREENMGLLVRLNKRRY